MSWLVIPFAVVCLAVLHLARKPGSFGSFGDAIRRSDHAAWEDAVVERRQQIEKWERWYEQGVISRMARDHEVSDLRCELDALADAEPKL